MLRNLRAACIQEFDERLASKASPISSRPTRPQYNSRSHRTRRSRRYPDRLPAAGIPMARIRGLWPFCRINRPCCPRRSIGKLGQPIPDHSASRKRPRSISSHVGNGSGSNQRYGKHSSCYHPNGSRRIDSRAPSRRTAHTSSLRGTHTTPRKPCSKQPMPSSRTRSLGSTIYLPRSSRSHHTHAACYNNRH